MKLLWGALAVLILPGMSLAASSEKATMDLVLPTENDALLRHDGPAFYQYIDRDYKGTKSKPWEGGQYGFVRDPVATPKGLIYTRFHEGMDIRPLHRDTQGEPTDEIHAIAAAKVVHVNHLPRH